MMKIVTSLVESEDFCLDLKLGGDYHCNMLWETSKANSAAPGPAQPTGESGGDLDQSDLMLSKYFRTSDGYLYFPDSEVGIDTR